jgi:hypothetical protein
MTTTYEMIRALPAKGFDWTGFTAALRAKVASVNAAQDFTLAAWDAAKGMRATRTAAMEMACFYVSKVSTRSNIIAPSQETAMWDSFEGGHHDVWNDTEAEEAATAEVSELISKLRAGA